MAHGQAEGFLAGIENTVLPRGYSRVDYAPLAREVAPVRCSVGIRLFNNTGADCYVWQAPRC